MARELWPNKAYAKFALNFEETVKSDKFTGDKVKVFTLQTGGGKSYYQDKEMPLVLHEVFPDMKYIFRLSPTKEVANDGTFSKVEELTTNKLNFSFIQDPPSNSILDCLGRIPNTVLCVSCTHTYFLTHFKRLLKYAKNSVLIIEEAHQFIGCADAGRDAYIVNFGYSSEYTAETWQRIEKWRDINPRILGFTATPTEHHVGNPGLSDQFEVHGKLAPLEDILPSQAWLNPPKSYSFTKTQGESSIKPAVWQSIDEVFDRENKLHKLKNFDININPKLSALYICGDARGIWGCSIHETRKIIADYLLSEGFGEESDKMIATMVENSSGGNTLWGLDGSKEQVETADEVFTRLQDPNDPVRFLLVINRGRSGINVHNLTAAVICRIRDPREIRTPIPIQIFGRLNRLNPGTGSIVRDKYINNLDNYLRYYPEDYGVDIDTVIETIKISNTFDIWHPSNDKAKRTWEESLVEFEKDYVNTYQKGYDYLYQFTGVEKPPLTEFLPINLTIERECNGELVKYNVNKEVTEWKGGGTLDAFFNITKKDLIRLNYYVEEGV